VTHVTSKLYRHARHVSAANHRSFFVKTKPNPQLWEVFRYLMKIKQEPNLLKKGIEGRSIEK
jgi:hypothetical protein